MLKPFDYWPVWLQCVAVHVMRTSVSLWREQGALSFYFKSRRWSQCGQGAGLVLTAQAQKTPCTVNPCVSTATGVNCHSPCTFTDSLVRATGWAAVWQDPFKQVLPPSCTRCRLFCSGDVVGPFQVWAVSTTYFDGYQLSIFSLSLWMASLKQFSKSVSFCPMCAPAQE